MWDPQLGLAPKDTQSHLVRTEPLRRVCSDFTRAKLAVLEGGLHRAETPGVPFCASHGRTETTMALLSKGSVLLCT